MIQLTQKYIIQLTRSNIIQNQYNKHKLNIIPVKIVSYSKQTYLIILEFCLLKSV